MKNAMMRILPALIFTAVAVVSIVQHCDYLEAAIWMLLALAVVLPVIPVADQNKRTLQFVAAGFMILGIILLILRVFNVLPVPVRPLE